MDNKLTDRCKPIEADGLHYYVVDRMDEVKAEMKRLLKVVDDICVEKGLKYWIDGGTLIGAIRHGGFIPWDDDIDISMYKRDYDILIKELSRRGDDPDVGEYLLYGKDKINQHCCNYLCSKKDLYGRLRGSFSVIPVKLDIRPINVIPDSEKEIALSLELKEIANEHIFNKKVRPLTSASERWQKMSRERFFEFYNGEYGFGNEDDPGNVLSFPYFEYSSEKVYPSDFFSKIKRVDYDGMMTNIPESYHVYLQELYGDYMAFPELESRVPAVYEYKSFGKPFSKIAGFLMKKDRGSRLSRLRYFISLHGIRKFIAILREIKDSKA